jgi:hypothetical protein
MKGNVYQCHNGHIYCSKCYTKLGGCVAKCPACAQRLGNIRNRSVEKHRDRLFGRRNRIESRKEVERQKIKEASTKAIRVLDCRLLIVSVLVICLGCLLMLPSTQKTSPSTPNKLEKGSPVLENLQMERAVPKLETLNIFQNVDTFPTKKKYRQTSSTSAANTQTDATKSPTPPTKKAKKKTSSGTTRTKDTSPTHPRPSQHAKKKKKLGTDEVPTTTPAAGVLLRDLRVHTTPESIKDFMLRMHKASGGGNQPAQFP